MTDVPKDIMEAAFEVWKEVNNLVGEPSHKKVAAIASAILAERERRTPAVVTPFQTGKMPLDGTPIYIRTVQPYRFLPYKPNSQQAKRGEKGRWQAMNEYGGWDNCPHPLGNEWSHELPSLSSGAGRSEERG